MKQGSLGFINHSHAIVWVKVKGAVMPHEDRRIFFSYAEVQEAVAEFALEKGGKPMPAGQIVTINAIKADGSMMDCVLENRKTNHLENHILSRDFIAGALMMFCRARKIPLAKAANKVVEIGKDCLVLRTQILHG